MYKRNKFLKPSEENGMYNYFLTFFNSYIEYVLKVFNSYISLHSSIIPESNYVVHIIILQRLGFYVYPEK